MNEQDMELGPTCEALLQESRRITPETSDEVRRLTLYIDDPAFRVAEGQSIGVVVPGPHPFGNKYHVRRYSIANSPRLASEQAIALEILVRRCFYLDEVSGERYPGIASNFLCDALPGDRNTLSGPYRSAFKVPLDNRDNLVMIGTGTGIAPFRAFVQHIYRKRPDWKGQVRLFYGARTGMDLLYTNDEESDLTNYYDEKTFKAFRSLLSRPLARDEQALRNSLEDHAAEAWDLMRKPNTRVYLAGLGKVAETFDQVMSKAAGSAESWQKIRNKIVEEGRWSELIYN